MVTHTHAKMDLHRDIDIHFWTTAMVSHAVSHTHAMLRISIILISIDIVLFILIFIRLVAILM